MTKVAAKPDFILTLTCTDKPGIVAAVASTLAKANCNIEESSQYGDPQTERFFMRIRFTAPPQVTLEQLRKELAPVAKRFVMWWELKAGATRPRVIIMVSKTAHCLTDLLFRWQIGALPMDLTRIVSNHNDLRDTAEHASVTYSHIPVRKDGKPQAERQLRRLIEDDQADLIILARYMQILSPELTAELHGRVINIHHSFLPGFKGAKPYHRAHARGVKLIGATAHYATPDLDEGPIIEQETERVTHAMSVADFIAAGRDIERSVLARAVKYHLEQRVLLNDGKTVVFR